MKVNLIMLNYQGRHLLERYLGPMVEAAQASRHSCRVTVLDNCSTDGSVDYVRQRFPQVSLIQAKENKVLCSFNEVVRDLDDEIVLLLNNDLLVDRGFVDPLVAVFERHPDALFAATYGDRSIAKIRWGTLTADIAFPGHEQLLDQPGVTLNTGCGAFDRRKFLKLGGFDELYLPGRYEDVDLCYRGWKRGWKGYYVPQSRWTHEGGASFKRYFTERQIDRLVFRNSVLCMVKNASDGWLWAGFLAGLIARLAGFAVRGKWHMLAGFVDALRRLPQALRARPQAQAQCVVSDAAAIQMINRALK